MPGERCPTDDMILSSLCWYDPRNPNYYAADDPELQSKPRDNCACDSCFYGRDQLALLLIGANEANAELTKRIAGAVERAERAEAALKEAEQQRDDWRDTSRAAYAAAHGLDWQTVTKEQLDAMEADGKAHGDRKAMDCVRRLHARAEKAERERDRLREALALIADRGAAEDPCAAEYHPDGKRYDEFGREADYCVYSSDEADEVASHRVEVEAYAAAKIARAALKAHDATTTTRRADDAPAQED